MTTQGAEFIVGIDGGGTGCRVAFADTKGEIIAEASGGPANTTSDFDAAVRNISSTLRDAAKSAGIDAARIRSAVAHAGVAGVLSQSDADAVALQLPFAKCSVSDDRLTSVIGALGSRDGALVSVGTGTFVAIKRGSNTRYIGGWGLQIGDQASGAWLGRALLARCVLVSDGLCEASDLTRAVLARFNDDPTNISRCARNADPSAYAALAPQILTAAEREDHTALSLLTEGADYLNRCLASANLSATDVICLTGGLGRHYAPFLTEAFQQKLVVPTGSALDGALTLARQACDNAARDKS
jgi:glucosamine kinase